MINIKELISLQECLKKIDENQKVIKDGSYMIFLKKLKSKYEGLDAEYKNKAAAISNLKVREAELVKFIDLEQKNLKECTHNLYETETSDPRLIEGLEKQESKLKAKIGEYENESVECMEKLEQLTSDSAVLKNKILEIRKEFYDYKTSIRLKIEKAKEEIKENIDKSEDIKSKIDKETLNNFMYLVETKGNAVARLDNGTCSGCKVSVSSATKDDALLNNKLIHCDNCGRILYVIKENE